MAERRDVGEERRLDVLAGDEQLVRVISGRERGGDEILPLGDEQAELVAPAALVELANELELLVLARGDQVSC
jgi:hypothetical protein